MKFHLRRSFSTFFMMALVLSVVCCTPARAATGHSDSQVFTLDERPQGDTDGDGLSDAVEGNVDLDGDGLPNYRDPDSDGDGVFDGLDTDPYDLDNPDKLPLVKWPVAIAILLLGLGVVVLRWRRGVGTLLVLLSALLSAQNAAAQGPIVSNVTVSVRTGVEHGIVDVYYDLADPQSTACEVTLLLSKDGGATFPFECETTTGDVGQSIRPGSGKHIVWNGYRDLWGELINEARLRVVAYDGEGETIMLPGNVPLVMVWIPAGTFVMGSDYYEYGHQPNEEPQHEVTLSHGFWMGKYELTKGQWQAMMGTTPWVGQEEGIDGPYITEDPNSPAVYISWSDMQAFITSLNAYTGLTFRIPTEAEWEYACRAGTTTGHYWGETGWLNISDYAWWQGNAWNVYLEAYAHVVGLKLPNAFGLYDMSGNIWEWVQDWYGAYGSGSVTDPTGPASGTARVIRGGAFTSMPVYARSAYRWSGNSETWGTCDVGFRLAR